MKTRWVAFAALGSIGGFAVIGKVALGLGSSLAWSIPAMMMLGGALVGALMGRATPLRPFREPALGTALGTALFVAVALTGQAPPAWMLAYGVPEQLVVAGLAVLVGVAAAGGAALAQRFPIAQAPSTAWVVSASALATSGALGLAVGLMTAFSNTERSAITYVALFVVLIGAGFITQLVVRARRPWESASGVALLVVLNALSPGPHQTLPAALVGAAVCALLASLGARVAWRMTVAHELEDATEVPAARVRAT